MTLDCTCDRPEVFEEACAFVRSKSACDGRCGTIGRPCSNCLMHAHLLTKMDGDALIEAWRRRANDGQVRA